MATIYFWLQEQLPKNFHSNLHFWQIARGPTNFLFSTGLTKSTRQTGQDWKSARNEQKKWNETSRQNEQTEFDKNFRCNSGFFHFLRALTKSLLAAVVESGGWSGLNIIYQIFGHLAGHLGRARGPRRWFMGFSPIAPSALSWTMGNSIRPCVTQGGCLTPVGSRMEAKKHNK